MRIPSQNVFFKGGTLFVGLISSLRHRIIGSVLLQARIVEVREEIDRVLSTGGR